MLRSLWPFTLRGSILLVAATGMIVVGVMQQTQLFVFTGLALALLVVASVVALWVRPLVREVSRTISATVVSAGTHVQVRIRLDVGAARAPRLRWEDTLSAEHLRRHGDVDPDVWGMADATYAFEPSRRGEHAFGPLWITAVDAMGLARRRQPFATRTSIIVGPAVAELTDADVTDVAGAGGRPVSAYAGDGTDDLVPRPYMHGDSRRRVHWKATAHRGELMVRQEEHEAAPTATIIVDRQTRDRDALETVLSASASMALRLSSLGFSVDVIDTDGSTHVRRLGADPSDLLSALAHCDLRAPGSVASHGHGARPADGPLAIAAAEEAVSVTHAVEAVAHGRPVLAVLVAAPPAVTARLREMGRPVGDLRAGIDAAWREAVVRERA